MNANVHLHLQPDRESLRVGAVYYKQIRKSERKTPTASESLRRLSELRRCTLFPFRFPPRSLPLSFPFPFLPLSLVLSQSFSTAHNL